VGERENTELVKQGYQHFKNGDIQGLLGLLSEDVEWTQFEIEGVPFSGTRRRPERVGEFFSQVFDTEEPLHFEPSEFVAQGEKVVALGHYAWRVKSTGREYETDFVHVFTVRDGKVAKYQEFMDTAVVGAAYRGS
jgi:ketosteroid isomerase-like protein